MDVLNDILTRVKDFQRDTDSILIDTVRRNEEKVFTLNTQQLSKGINAEGDKITPPYSRAYKRKKRKLGQPVNRVTLRLTGEFHASLRNNYSRRSFEIISKDDKAKYLLKRYTPAVLGLNDISLEKLINELRPAVQNEFKKRIMK